jgi:hypothetical protein
MYIRNIEKIERKFECGSLLGKYLIRQGVPVLSQANNKYYFADTEWLRKQLDSMPWIYHWMGGSFE